MSGRRPSLSLWLDAVRNSEPVVDELRRDAAQEILGDPALRDGLRDLLGPRGGGSVEYSAVTPQGDAELVARPIDALPAPPRIHPLRDARQWIVAGQHETPLGQLLDPPPGVTYLIHRASTRTDPRHIWWIEPGAPTSGVAMARVCEELAQQVNDALFISADYFLSRTPEASYDRFRVGFRVRQIVDSLSRLHDRYPKAELHMIGVSFGAASGLMAAKQLRAAAPISFHLYGLVVPGSITNFTRQFALLVSLERAACRLPGRSAAVSRFVVGGLMAGLSIRTYPERYQKEMTRYSIQAVRMGLLDLDEMYRAVSEVKHLDVPPGEDSAKEFMDLLRSDPRIRCGADPADPWVDRPTLESAGSRASWFPDTGHSPFELPVRDRGMMKWLRT